jgi:SAM-dependent methyltransferase
MLLRLLSSIVRPKKPAPADVSQGAGGALRVAPEPGQRYVLDVGGGHRDVALPKHYAAWRRLMLDINPNADPDVLLDARALGSLPAAQFDAVYCSHNLEHYREHEVAQVLAGFAHVLKPAGFVEIRVPDIQWIARELVENGRELDDTLYTSPAGPIRALDVLYGHSGTIERTGVDFFAHKTGFTRRTLRRALEAAGFSHAYFLAPLGRYEIRTVALRAAPGEPHRALFGIGEASEAL